MNRILIAEDQLSIARLLKKGLETQGYKPTISGDGQEALHLAQSQDFALMILDLDLPNKDGLAVLKELRNKDQQLPVIILTARSNAKDKALGFTHGANDYMTKPFRFKELFARIQEQLEKSSILINLACSGVIF